MCIWHCNFTRNCILSNAKYHILKLEFQITFWKQHLKRRSRNTFKGLNTWYTLTHLLNDKITGQQITPIPWLSSAYTVLKVSGGCWNGSGECWFNKKELNLCSNENGNKRAPLAGTTCPLAPFSMFAITSCPCEGNLCLLSLLSLFQFHYLWLILALGKDEATGVILI